MSFFIPKQAKELTSPFAEHAIFGPEKTASMSNSRHVFPESNLACSASVKSPLLNLFGYIWRFFCFCWIFAASSLMAEWSFPVDLFSQASPAIPSPNIAVDKHGNATAIWLYQDINAPTNPYSVQSAYKPFGKKWQKPAIISQSNLPFSFATIAIDGDGNATAIWANNEGAYHSIQAAYKPFKKNWEHPKRISQGNLDSVFPQIAVDEEGNAKAVWASHEGTIDTIRAASKPFKKSWKPSKIISPENINAATPQIAVDEEGNATAVWVSPDEGLSGSIRAASKPFRKSWKPSKIISNNDEIVIADSLTVDLAVSTNGAAAAVWSSFDPNLLSLLIHAAYKPAGKSWQPPQTVSQIGNFLVFPQIALDPKGNATAVWLDLNGGDIQASSKTACGSWPTTTPTTLSHIGSTPSLFQIAVDHRGNVISVWGTNGLINASYKPFKKPWQITPDVISPPTQITFIPKIAMNSKGYAVAVWQRNISNSCIVQSATFKRRS